jgi:hypothetical protein
MTEVFEAGLDELQPSQLFICEEKLAKVMATAGQEALEPVPVKRLSDRWVITDGHTRAAAAAVLGRKTIQVIQEQDDLDWEAYEICVAWCQEAGIHSVADLASRIVPMEQYEELWYKRCRAMHQQLAERRGR